MGRVDSQLSMAADQARPGWHRRSDTRRRRFGNGFSASPSSSWDATLPAGSIRRLVPWQTSSDRRPQRPAPGCRVSGRDARAARVALLDRRIACELLCGRASSDRSEGPLKAQRIGVQRASLGSGIRGAEPASGRPNGAVIVRRPEIKDPTVREPKRELSLTSMEFRKIHMIHRHDASLVPGSRARQALAQLPGRRGVSPTHTNGHLRASRRRGVLIG